MSSKKTYSPEELKKRKAYKNGNRFIPGRVKKKPEEPKEPPKPVVKVEVKPEVKPHRQGMSAETSTKIVSAARATAAALVASTQEAKRSNDIMLSIAEQLKASKPKADTRELKAWEFKVVRKGRRGITDVLATPIYKKAENGKM